MATSLHVWQVAVFLLDMKGRLEVSVAGKQDSVRNYDSAEGLVTSHLNTVGNLLRVKTVDPAPQR